MSGQQSTYVEAICGECFERLGGDVWEQLQLEMQTHVRDQHVDIERVIFSLTCDWPTFDTSDFEVFQGRLTKEQRRTLGEWDDRIQRLFSGCDRALVTGRRW
ncbi:MAG: hypothetical protein AB7U23_10095 [Dehalococcoidia bacterium]